MYLENITDEDYIHAQKVFEKFNLKNLSDYHDLYFQSDTLLLADVFENFRNKCIEIYELDPARFLSEVELELLTDIDMLLIVEKGIRGGIYYPIHRYAKANNKYIRNYDKNIESLYLMYLDTNNLYGWRMSQNLPVSGFKWVKKLSKFDECCIKNYDENSDKGYILEVDDEYPKKLFNLYKDLPFLAERKKTEKCKKLVCNIHKKENYVVRIRALKQALNYGLIPKQKYTE